VGGGGVCELRAGGGLPVVGCGGGEGGGVRGCGEERRRIGAGGGG